LNNPNTLYVTTSVTRGPRMIPGTGKRTESDGETLEQRWPELGIAIASDSQRSP